MNRFLKGAGIAALLLYAVFVIGERALSIAQTSKRARVSKAQYVDDLFKSNCARCHGADGSGDTPLGHMYKTPDLTDPEWWKEHDIGNKKLAAIVAGGKSDMPAFGKKLKKNDIDLLIKYVRLFASQR